MFTSSWLGHNWVPTSPRQFSHSFLPYIPFSERSLFCPDDQVQPLFTAASHSFSKVPSSPSLSPSWFQTVLGFGGVEDKIWWPLYFQALPVSLVFNEWASSAARETSSPSVPTLEQELAAFKSHLFYHPSVPLTFPLSLSLPSSFCLPLP